MKALGHIVSEMIKAMFCRPRLTSEQMMCRDISAKVEKYRNSIQPCGYRTYYPPKRNTYGKAD